MNEGQEQENRYLHGGGVRKVGFDATYGRRRVYGVVATGREVVTSVKVWRRLFV
jgi:hypothetical protein